MWNVRWTPEAEQQYYAVLQFWIEHNHSAVYSQKIVNEVEQIERLLSINPFFGQECVLNNTLLKIRRVVVLSNFSVLRRVTDEIQIVSFWDNRNDPEKLKKQI